MSVEFLSEKKLRKIKNKLNCPFDFIKGYVYTHKKGHILYILFDVQNAPYAFSKYKHEYCFKKLPLDFEGNYYKYRLDFYYSNGEMTNDIYLIGK